MQLFYRGIHAIPSMRKKTNNTLKTDTENEALRNRCRELEARVHELEKAAKEREAFYSDVQKVRGEHHLAEQLQRSMLPKTQTELIRSFPIDLYADMDTAWEIGGDYYDFFPLDEHRLFFCVADVSGKSVSAAMFSMVVKTVVKMSLLNGDSLDEVFYNTSRQLYQCQNGEIRMFVTLWGGILNTETGTVDYVNAGHEPPLLVTTQTVPQFVKDVSGLPIAAYFNSKKPEKSRYTVHHLQLERGDALLLYTDGVNECADRHGNRLGRKRIQELTQQCNAERLSIQEWVCYLQRHVIAHSNHAEQDDDITLLGVRWL